MSSKLIDFNALSTYKTQSDLKYQDKLTAGGGIAINNNVIAVSPEFEEIIISNKSVPSGTIYELDTVTLMPGSYVIVFTCAFESNNTGYRQCGFSLNNTDLTGFGRNWGDFRASVTGSQSQTRVSGVFQISANDYPNGQKFYFLASQNSGSTLTATPRCYYFKF